MVAAEEAAVLLQPVADDLHLAVLARGRELVDRALEAVEGVAPAALRDRERLVVVVAAGFALRHDRLLGTDHLVGDRPPGLRTVHPAAINEEVFPLPSGLSPPSVHASAYPGPATPCAGL